MLRLHYGDLVPDDKFAEAISAKLCRAYFYSGYVLALLGNDTQERLWAHNLAPDRAQKPFWHVSKIFGWLNNPSTLWASRPTKPQKSRNPGHLSSGPWRRT
jgi:hypothetical protein